MTPKVNLLIIALILLSFIIIPASAAEGKNEKIPVLINFKGKSSPELLEANAGLVKAQGGDIKYEYKIIHSMAAELSQSAIDALSKNPNIDSIELDGQVQLIDPENQVHLFTEEIPWGITRIGATNAQSSGFKGTGVKVAVIDTGIDYTHPDLEANYIGGYDFFNGDNDPMDDNSPVGGPYYGHGTHVAGTVAAAGNDIGVVGVAPESKLYALKIFNSAGSTTWSTVIAAIDWAVNNNANVITMSLGGSDAPSSFKDACDNAYSKGIVIVAAAGNSGGNVMYPAAYSSVIAVSAIDSTNEITSWSCYGPEIEFAAPGTNIKSTVPGGSYDYKDGTSMATPHVTGTVALLLSSKISGTGYDLNKNGKWDPAEVRLRLQNTATDLGTTGKDDYYGYGLINAYAAVKDFVPINDNPPIANAGADKTATVGLAVSFNGSASTDDKGIASYSWDFDASNGITSDATGVTAAHTYTTAGTYNVTLTVTDTGGQKSTDTLQVVVSSGSTDTVSYTPTYDNRLRADSPNNVLSTSTYIDIGKSTASSRDVMVFDLSAYNTTDTISKATLSLYWYYPAGATRSSDTVVEIYRPVEWDPKYVSWNYRTSGTLWSTAGGNWFDKNTISQGSTPYASLTFPAATVPGNKYYDFDVTQLVQDYVSGKYKNTGFFLKAKSENGNYIAFYSSKWSNAAQRPKLTVTAKSSASGSVDNPPVANAGADKTATTGSVVNFDASASTDDKGIASYSWDFDASNGITSDATGVTATHTYTTAGTYNVTLTVTDTSGQKSTDILQVVVSSSVDNPPVANAGADKTATTGSVVNFDASASTDDKGIASYSWDFDASNGITSDATGVTAAHTYATAGTYNVTLTVTDTGGQKSTDTLQLVVSNGSTNTVSYTPTYDNRMRQASPTTVISTSTYLDIGSSTTSYRDVMLFDLGAYNTTDTISKATLSLYWYYPAGATRTSDTVVEIYRPVEWDPKYVSWNYRTSGTLWNTAGGNWFDKNTISQGSTPYTSLTFPAATVPGNKYYEFDVTQLVQDYVSGKYKNTGFFLKAKNENGNYIAFYSSKWSNVAQRPKLTVTATSSASGSVDNPPVANAGVDKTATTGSVVNFDASASTDDKGITSYSWDFDASNGITSDATGVTAAHTYTIAGNYTVTLTVTDSGGQKSTDTLQVVVSSGTNDTVSYTPTYDNRMRQASPTTVISTSTYIDIGSSTTSYRDVMLFDLSAYSTTDTISKATLSLYWYYPVGATRSSDTMVEIYRPVEWDPKYVSWNYRTSGTLWSTAGGNWFDKNAISQGSTPYASLTFAGSKVPDNKYYEFDVTQLVRDYVSGKYKNTGFFLKAKTESGNYIAFYSSDWSNAAQRPKLTVTRQ